MRYLYLIPARGGSKGIPKKNIKKLGGEPLIVHAIHVAQQVAQKDDVICVSTDAPYIIETVHKHTSSKYTPFVRPTKLANDTASSYEVILHAVEYYKTQSIIFDAIILLQPTSPFRTKEQLQKAKQIFNKQLDMVVSVVTTHANPYYNLFELGTNGFLKKSKQGNFTRRQDCPPIYEYNGAIYIINTLSLEKYEAISDFKKVVPYKMPLSTHVDLDTPIDWAFAELLLQKEMVLLP